MLEEGKDKKTTLRPPLQKHFLRYRNILKGYRPLLLLVWLPDTCALRHTDPGEGPQWAYWRTVSVSRRWTVVTKWKKGEGEVPGVLVVPFNQRLPLSEPSFHSGWSGGDCRLPFKSCRRPRGKTVSSPEKGQTLSQRRRYFSLTVGSTKINVSTLPNVLRSVRPGDPDGTYLNLPSRFSTKLFLSLSDPRHRV